MAKGRGQWLGATPSGEQVNELLHVVSEQNELLSGYKVGPLIHGSCLIPSPGYINQGPIDGPKLKLMR